MWKWLPIRRREALVLFGLFVAIGLWLGNTAWFSMAADNGDVPWSHVFLWEMTGALSAYVCTYIPFVAAYNASRPSPRFFAIHTAGFVLFAAAHTSLMIGSRMVLYPLLGWGDYTFGHSALRLPMEWHKDLLSYVLIATTFVLLSAWRDNQARQLREARIETELRDAQLRALVGQLNPHFLFNALNTISAVMYTDLAKTDRLLADLGHMLRASLASGTTPTWSLADERAHTEHFLAVMLARFEDRLTVRWDVEAAASQIQVPRFTLQLLVENAIKHNQDSRDKLDIAITAHRDGDRVSVSVVDNGRGFGIAPIAPGTGLETLRQALALCHGTLDLGRAETGGASVRVMVPA